MQDKELRKILFDIGEGFYWEGTDPKEGIDVMMEIDAPKLIAWRNKYAQEYAKKMIGRKERINTEKYFLSIDTDKDLAARNTLRAEQRKLNNELKGEM